MVLDDRVEAVVFDYFDVLWKAAVSTINAILSATEVSYFSVFFSFMLVLAIFLCCYF